MRGALGVDGGCGKAVAPWLGRHPLAESILGHGPQAAGQTTAPEAHLCWDGGVLLSDGTSPIPVQPKT